MQIEYIYEILVSDVKGQEEGLCRPLPCGEDHESGLGYEFDHACMKYPCIHILTLHIQLLVPMVLFRCCLPVGINDTRFCYLDF